ncbi:cell division protein FtsA [Alphaproteobacteria bacterium]|nr:cell division protein FtsA [Alphaproteobacteria bacterium]
MHSLQKSKYQPRGSLLAALDIGGSKVACFIARVLDNAGNFEVIGVGHSASEGFQDGCVTDIAKAELVIRKTVHAAENMAAEVMKGYPLREVVVNLPGIHVKSHGRCIDVQIAGHKVSANDINRAMAKAQESILSPHYELVHTIPVDYRLDGKGGVQQPIDMHGEHLSVDVHLITGDSTALRNMADGIQRSHLDISAFCAAGYASGLASLVEDEIGLGCTVVDIGSGQTSIAVFHSGAMIFHDSVALGGRHLTNDIAKGLTISLNDAERIKAMYGNAMASHNDENELIDVPRLGEESEGREPNHIPRSLLVGIIQPRVEEIFEMVRAKLQDSGLGHTIGRRVVLTGGGSQLAGIKELSAHVLDKQVRLGKPIRLQGIPDAVSGPAFSTVAGLLTYISERSHEMPAEIMSQAQPVNVWERTRQWVKENW